MKRQPSGTKVVNLIPNIIQVIGMHIRISVMKTALSIEIYVLSLVTCPPIIGPEVKLFF